MAARHAAVMTGDDDDGSDDLSQILNPPGGGMSNGGQAGQQHQQAPEVEFEIIEADDDLQPFQQQRQEAALTDDSADDGTYVGRQQRQADADHQSASRARDKRQRRKDGRDRTWQELEALRRENEELRNRFNEIEPRLVQMTEGQARAQLSELDRAISDNNSVFERAEDRIAEAITNGDTQGLKAAMRERDKAVIDGQHLQVRRNFVANNAPRPGVNPNGQQQAPVHAQPPAPAPTPIAVQRHIDDFAENHDWYNPNSRDRDSQIVLMLDNEVAGEGFDPRSPEYWDELEDRMRQVLPHRFNERQQPAPRQQQAQQAAPQRRGPMTAGPADRAPAPSKHQVVMTPARRQALIQSGVLDSDGKTVINNEKFTKILKKYQQYDRDNSVGRQ